MRRLLFSVCALLALQAQMYGQEVLKNVDSVLVALQNAPADTSKAILYQKIAGHYNVTHLDSAKAFAKQGITLSRKLNYPYGEMMNLNTLGNYHERKTQYDSSMTSYNRALEIAKQTNSTKGFAVIYNNIATIHIRKGKYDLALNLLFEALKAEEELNDKNGIAQAYNNIGVVYYYQKNMTGATEYLTKALQTQEQLGNLSGLINGYNNVGAIHNYVKKYEEAIVAYQKGLEISKRIGDRKLEAVQINNIALAYNKMAQFEKAQELFEASLKIREEIKDYNGMSQTLVSFGELCIDRKDAVNAKAYILKAIELAEKYNLREKKVEAYSAFAKYSALKKDFETFTIYAEKSRKVSDSLRNELTDKAMAETEVKFETAKKEKEIFEQRTEIAEQSLKIQKRNNLIYGIAALALILGLIGYLVYNQQRLKNRQLKKEAELQTALAKIETQNHLQEQRLRISRDLHDNIGSQLTFIISSLDTLKYGLKDKDDTLKTKITDIGVFTKSTINELRDTIWAMNKEEITLEDLQSRISNFLESARKSRPEIAFRFNLDPQIDADYAFTAVEGINAYRVIQEAVNNSMKYAFAKIAENSPKAAEIKTSTVDLKIGQTNGQFEFEIKDNGGGFDKSKGSFGNGLGNMKKRVKDINGSISITSQSDKGVQIKFSVPKKE